MISSRSPAHNRSFFSFIIEQFYTYAPAQFSQTSSRYGVPSEVRRAAQPTFGARCLILLPLVSGIRNGRVALGCAV